MHFLLYFSFLEKPVATIGNVTITTVKVEKEEKPISCEDPELSDKDEAEGDDSELEEESEEQQPVVASPDEKQQKQPIKQYDLVLKFSNFQIFIFHILGLVYLYLIPWLVVVDLEWSQHYGII